MESPFYSVIVLTHNRSSMLLEAIESVLKQSFSDFELIIVDDHSTDNTRDVVQSISDKRIKYCINVNSKGQPGARNTGLKESRGKWITFLDDDDIWLPMKLEKQYEKISQVDNEVGLVYTGYAVYDFEKGKELSQFIPEKEGWIQKDLLFSNCIGAICSVAVRSDVFKKAGRFDERFQSMVDLEMWVRISEHYKVALIKDVLLYIRKSNSDRISVNMNRKLDGSIMFWDKYKHLINSDSRLRNSTASRVFMFAVKAKNRKYIMKALPWTLAGIVIDMKSFIKSCWSVLLVLTKSKRA